MILFVLSIDCTVVANIYYIYCNSVSRVAITAYWWSRVAVARVRIKTGSLILVQWTILSLRKINNRFLPSLPQTNQRFLFPCQKGGNSALLLLHPSLYCKRRIKTEEKAKVVAAVWGEEFIQLLAALAILPRTIWRTGWIHPFVSNHPGAIHPILQIVQCKTASAAKN